MWFNWPSRIMTCDQTLSETLHVIPCFEIHACMYWLNIRFEWSCATLINPTVHVEIGLLKTYFNIHLCKSLAFWAEKGQFLRCHTVRSVLQSQSTCLHPSALTSARVLCKISTTCLQAISKRHAIHVGDLFCLECWCECRPCNRYRLCLYFVLCCWNWNLSFSNWA